jgi:hypothetical protein
MIPRRCPRSFFQLFPRRYPGSHFLVCVSMGSLRTTTSSQKHRDPEAAWKVSPEGIPEGQFKEQYNVRVFCNPRTCIYETNIYIYIIFVYSYIYIYIHICLFVYRLNKQINNMLCKLSFCTVSLEQRHEQIPAYARKTSKSLLQVLGLG